MLSNCGAREDSWESLGSKEIKPVNPEGNQLWIFIGSTDAKAEAPILWPSDGKSRLIGIDPDVGNDWRQEEKGATVDEMIGWHHWFNGCEFKQTPGDSDEQGRLACCNHGFAKSNVTNDWTTTRNVHWVGDAIQPSHPLLPRFSPAFSLSQHQGLFQWVGSSHQVAKALEFQLQHSGLISFRIDWLLYGRYCFKWFSVLIKSSEPTKIGTIVICTLPCVSEKQCHLSKVTELVSVKLKYQTQPTKPRAYQYPLCHWNLQIWEA